MLWKKRRDFVYNSPEKSVVQYECVSKKVSRDILKLINESDILLEQLNDSNSICNRTYSKKYNFDRNNILKLTFDNCEIDFNKLFYEVSKMQFVRVGRYYRGNGRHTLLVAFDKKVSLKAAFNVLRFFVKFFASNDINDKNKKYMNLSLFFFYILFGGRNVEIKPCKGMDLYVARGKNTRIKPLCDKTNEKIDDDRHELDVICDYLKKDCIGDTAIVIAGSLVVKKNPLKDEISNNHDELNEYDGIVVRSYLRVITVAQRNLYIQLIHHKQPLEH